MRNKILFALLLIAVFALGVLSVRAWDKYEVEQRVKAEITRQEEQARANAAARLEEQRKQAEAAEKERLAKECAEGLAAYNKLSPAQQRAAAKPECDLEQVQ